MQKDKCERLCAAIAALTPPRKAVKLMEVCGTHTMAIAKNALRSLLPSYVELLSGPGCPVCVTSAEQIDACIALCDDKARIITLYGDMLRVPGTRRTESLLERRARGADVRIVFSPMDALKIARENAQREVVFIGVGFETSAPGTAAAIDAAKEENVKNFSVYSLLKRVEPALYALRAAPDFSVDGLLLPGHVASIVGEDGFSFVSESLFLPGVIAGFEAEDILLAVYRLLLQLEKQEVRLENLYPRAVAKAGNPLALSMIDKVFTRRDALWRGLGLIKESGLEIGEAYAAYDAAKRYQIAPCVYEAPTPCRCAEVLRGVLSPKDCPLFAVHCTEENPAGPCMVSTEGACAAAYRYGL